MSDMLTKVRKLNWVLQQSAVEIFSFEELCKILSDLTDSNIYIIDKKGKALGVYFTIEEDSVMEYDDATASKIMPEEYNRELLKIQETEANVTGEGAMRLFKYAYSTKDKLHTVIPIMSGGVRLGTMLLTRYGEMFGMEELILGEYGATVVGLEIQRRKNTEIENDARRKTVVQMAIGTLSYSEIDAMQQIFNELGGNEGLLVASKVADRSGITRSVIVNALRKLESAGVIESRSLGMKGTHIRILNDKLLGELRRTTL